MTNLQKLESHIRGLGWFTKQIKMTITYESEFEGFYGKASEAWEQRATIEIKSPDEKLIKSVKIVGGRNQTIDDVAELILKYLNISK